MPKIHYCIEVVELSTHKVVDTIDCHDKSRAMVEKAEEGMLINMDRERFSTRIVEWKERAPCA